MADYIGTDEDTRRGVRLARGCYVDFRCGGKTKGSVSYLVRFASDGELRDMKGGCRRGERGHLTAIDRFQFTLGSSFMLDANGAALGRLVGCHDGRMWSFGKKEISMDGSGG